MNTETDASGIQSEEMIDPRCIVKFRPVEGWKGEYGFDWFREGDYYCRHFGYTDYSTGTLIGKYVPKDPDEKEDPEDTFRQKAKYNKNKNEGEESPSDDCPLQFQKEYVRLKIKGQDEQYFVPILSLFYNKPGKNLSNVYYNQSKVEEWGPTRVPISIIADNYNEDVTKLEFVCDEAINIENVYIETSNGKKSVDFFEFRGKKYVDFKQTSRKTQPMFTRWCFNLVVKSEFEFKDSDSVGDGRTIKVYAKTTDDLNTDRKGTFAGQLNIIFRKVKTIDICMVGVYIKDNNTAISVPPNAIEIKEEKNNLKKFLAQAHIIPNFISDRSLYLEKSQISRYLVEDQNNGRKMKFKSHDWRFWLDLLDFFNHELDNVLMGEFEDLIDKEGKNIKETKEILKNSYKLYFINEKGEDVAGKAHDIGGKEAFILEHSHPETATHELLHCLGFYHSFSNCSKHTFKKYKTTNIMDYTKNGDYDRFSLWKWQWEQMRNARGLKYVSINEFKK